MIQRGSESGNVRDRPPSRGSLCVVGWLLLGRRSHRTESSLRCGFASSCVTRAARVLRERARERERTEARVPNHEPPKPVSHGARTTNRRGTCRSRGREGAFPVFSAGRGVSSSCTIGTRHPPNLLNSTAAAAAAAAATTPAHRSFLSAPPAITLCGGLVHGRSTREPERSTRRSRSR